jgi:hypothetical protein
MLLDDAGRPAHKVCGEAALAAMLGLQADKEPRTREAGSFPKGPPALYSPCKLCRDQQLWSPPSQERGVCARCWRAMEEEGTP